MTAVPAARSVEFGELDISRCPGCGADSGPDGVHIAGHSPIERGRMAIRYFACAACGLGANAALVQACFWISANPAGIAAVERYFDVLEEQGEEDPVA